MAAVIVSSGRKLSSVHTERSQTRRRGLRIAMLLPIEVTSVEVTRQTMSGKLASSPIDASTSCMVLTDKRLSL